MKSKNWIGLYLCTAVLVLTMIFCIMQTTPAYAWETWPAASTDDPNHSWTVVFDQAMNLSTINSQNIYVSNDAEGSTRISGINVSASDSTHALVSPPAGGWSSASKYYLIITQNVLTSEGMPLKDTVRMPFSFIQGLGKEAQTIDVINDGSQITVKVNGSQLYFDQQPYISNGHTMVPFRKIAEALGATVDWDSAKKKITIIGDKVVELTINSSVAKVNGAKVTLEAPAVITGGRTMVPLRFVGEAMGAKVNYTSTSNSQSAGLLTTDYWIPDLSRTYIYKYKQQVDGGYIYITETETWTQASNGTFHRVCVKQYEDRDTHIETDTFILDGNNIVLSESISREGSLQLSSYDTYKQLALAQTWNTTDFNGQSEVGTRLASASSGAQAPKIQTFLYSGPNVVIKQVLPGQTWKNNYVVDFNGKAELHFSEKITFVGFEEISCLGSTFQAAHIKTEGSSKKTKDVSKWIASVTSPDNYTVDSWLVKDIGLVKYSIKTIRISEDKTYTSYDMKELTAIK